MIFTKDQYLGTQTRFIPAYHQELQYTIANRRSNYCNAANIFSVLHMNTAHWCVGGRRD